MRHSQESPVKEKPKHSKINNLCWVLKRLWHLDKKIILFIFSIAPVSVALSLTASYFTKTLIDHIGLGKSFSQLVVLVIAFIVALLLLQILYDVLDAKRQGSMYYPTGVSQTEMSAHEEYFMDFENTEKESFKKIRSYAWMDATQGNCSLEFLRDDLQTAWVHLFGIITYASLLVALNPLILGVVAFTSVLSYFTTRWQPVYFEKNKHHWEKEERKKGYLQRLSDEFPKAKDIKLYGLEPWLNRMVSDYQAFLLMWTKRNNLRGFFASILAGFMTLLQDGVAYFVLIGLLLAGQMTVGDFVFYFGITGSIAGFLQGIVGDVAKLSTRSDKIAYYRDFFDFPNHFNHGEGAPLPVSPVKIELRDVHYRYSGAEEDTLKGINLIIEPGESLALVGVNGAGKTTLIKLICGLYSPTQGEILVNGKRIQEYNIGEYYSLISAVFQDIQSVAFTIFEFVASADIDRPTAREDAISAMQAADIYEKITTLPHGMDTHLMKSVYDDGVDLSGGEMQKLLLARAIYKNGTILILDEPTSALDPIAENKLYLQYRSLTQGKTSIYISHRFASTRFCDRIILLEDGVIKETGTHDELMRTDGTYAYMFGVQSKYYQEGEINE